MWEVIRYWINVVALALTLGGSLTLFYGFAATGTSLEVVEINGHPAAICAEEQAFITWPPVTPGPPCSKLGIEKPIAGVVFEHGFLIPIGWLAMIAGSGLQLVALGRAPTRTRDARTML